MRSYPQGKTFWHNVGTGSNQREKPILKRGGILADEMGKPQRSLTIWLHSGLIVCHSEWLTGLGKTMQTIALVCTDDTGEGVLAKPEDPDERFDDMTLIGAFSRDSATSAFR